MRGPRYLTSLGWLLLTASALGVWCQRRSPGYYFPLSKEPAIAARLAQKVTIPQTEFSLPELVAQLAEWAQVEMSVEEPRFYTKGGYLIPSLLLPTDNLDRAIGITSPQPTAPRRLSLNP